MFFINADILTNNRPLDLFLKLSALHVSRKSKRLSIMQLHLRQEQNKIRFFTNVKTSVFKIT